MFNTKAYYFTLLIFCPLFLCSITNGQTVNKVSPCLENCLVPMIKIEKTISFIFLNYEKVCDILDTAAKCSQKCGPQDQSHFFQYTTFYRIHCIEMEEALEDHLDCLKEASYKADVHCRGKCTQKTDDKKLAKEERQRNVCKNSSPTRKLKKRLQGGGRPLTFKDLDSQLAVWVRERRSKKLRISHSILQQQAVKMFNAEKDEEGFRGSRGWLIKFLAGHNFRLRVPTTVCQKPPSDYVEKIVDFLLYVSEVRQKYKSVECSTVCYYKEFTHSCPCSSDLLLKINERLADEMKRLLLQAAYDRLDPQCQRIHNSKYMKNRLLESTSKK